MSATLCVNYSCPRQVRGRIEHFVGRAAMDIEFLGERNIDRFVTEGLLGDVTEGQPGDVVGLYSLDFERIEQMEGFGQTSVNNLRKSIEDSKQQPLSRLLFALSIPEIGQVNARVLAAAFGNVDRILEADEEALAEVEGFGPIIAASVRAWFDDPHNRKLIEGLRAAGLRMEAGEPGRRGRRQRRWPRLWPGWRWWSAARWRASAATGPSRPSWPGEGRRRRRFRAAPLRWWRARTPARPSCARRRPPASR